MPLGFLYTALVIFIIFSKEGGSDSMQQYHIKDYISLCHIKLTSEVKAFKMVSKLKDYSKGCYLSATPYPSVLDFIQTMDKKIDPLLLIVKSMKYIIVYHTVHNTTFSNHLNGLRLSKCNVCILMMLSHISPPP